MTDQAPRAAPAVTPRLAATTLILRDSHAGLEVLMVRRSSQASFMPGAYVFPGGAVDAADNAAASASMVDEPVAQLRKRIGEVAQVGESALGLAVAALRECFEECGLWLGAGGRSGTLAPHDLSRWRAGLHAGLPLSDLAAEAGLRLRTSVLHPWSRWVTPVGLPKRFDTLFFVCPAPPGQVPTVDEGETTSLAWVHPPEALAARRRGEFQMEFATVQTVASLEPFARLGTNALLAHAAAQISLPPIHPRLKLDAEARIRGVLLPGQPGYDEAPGDGARP